MLDFLPTGIFPRRRYLSEKTLINLKNYKYVSGAYTPLETAMNPFWVFVTELLPMSMAPNLVTLTGLLVNASALAFLSPLDLVSVPSTLGCVIAGLSIFAYQTLDAVDGKQARRTGQASPLGQLFDHGCDSISLIVFILLNAQIY